MPRNLLNKFDDFANFLGATGITEVLFTNLDYLQNHTDFPARLVPGAQVFAVAEGLVMTASIQQTGVAFLGMDLNIEGPVFANDTLHVQSPFRARVEDNMQRALRLTACA